MIKDSGKREWNYVLVYKLDRFSRDKYATAIHKKTLKDNGVKLLSATEHIPDTPEVLLNRCWGYVEYYSAELRKRCAAVWTKTAKRVTLRGGFVIYGYKVETKVVIDTERGRDCALHFRAILSWRIRKGCYRYVDGKGRFESRQAVCAEPFTTSSKRRSIRVFITQSTKNLITSIRKSCRWRSLSA